MATSRTNDSKAKHGYATDGAGETRTPMKCKYNLKYNKQLQKQRLIMCTQIIVFCAPLVFSREIKDWQLQWGNGLTDSSKFIFSLQPNKLGQIYVKWYSKT